MEEQSGSESEKRSPPPPRPQPPLASPRRSLEETQFEIFNKLKTEAYVATSAAMTLDESGNKKEEAFKAYQEALLKIDKVVAVALSGGFPPLEVNNVDQLVYRMRITRKEILERVSDLQFPSSTTGSGPNWGYLNGPSSGASNPTESSSIGNIQELSVTFPQPYSVNEFEGQVTRTSNLYGQLFGNLHEIALEQDRLRNPLPLNAQEVFTIPDNIQIYFIETDDNVLAPSYPSFLRIIVLNPDAITNVSEAQFQRQVELPPAPAFLQVGDWTYPLIPRQSPIFHSSDGSYIFPDLTSSNEGASVGLILPPEVTDEQKKEFEEILLQLIGLKEFASITTKDETAGEGGAISLPKVISTADTDERTGLKYRATKTISVTPADDTISTSTRVSTRIAEGLMSGAETVAQGLIVGAEKTSELLNKGTHYLIGKINPVEEKPKIKPEVKSYMKTAKTITGHTVQISGYLVSQLGRGTVHLGRKIAPFVQSATVRLYAKTTDASEAETSQKVDQVLEVTGGALVGFGTVYLGLEHAAKVLASSLASNTVKVVDHRYGREAGSIADDAAATVGNTVVTGLNCRVFTPKAVAKRVVKDAGRASLEPGISKLNQNL